MLAAVVMPLCLSGCDNKTVADQEDPWEWNDKPKPNPDGEDQDDGTVYYPKEKGALRLVSYNVGSFAKFMTNSTEMVADMMNEIEADIIGINEVDSCNTRHNVNQAKELAAALGGWQWRYARAMPYRGGAYGNAVLVPSSVKILDAYTIALPKGTGSEPRSIAVVETPDYVFGVAHLDHTSEESVIGQVNVVNDWAQRLGITDKPVFFCGDMNSKPESAAIKLLETKWTRLSSLENTISSSAPTSCIDFVFHYKTSAPVKVLGAHTMTKFRKGDVTRASDHLPVYVDVQF